MVIPEDPPEVNWGDDDWEDDRRTKILIRVLIKYELEVEGYRQEIARLKEGRQ